MNVFEMVNRCREDNCEISVFVLETGEILQCDDIPHMFKTIIPTHLHYLKLEGKTDVILAIGTRNGNRFLYCVCDGRRGIIRMREGEEIKDYTWCILRSGV